MNIHLAESEPCPQCGEDMLEMHEGVCVYCCEENQRQLDEHNARFDWWESLSDAERGVQIRKAV